MTPLAEKRHRAIDYSSRRFERIAFLFVVHGETPESLRVSVDGNEDRAQNLYKMTREGQPLITESFRDGDFLLCHLPAWMVIKFGITQEQGPKLTDSRDWSAEQRSQWKQLRSRLNHLRDTLVDLKRRAKGHRKHYDPRPFGWTA